MTLSQRNREKYEESRADVEVNVILANYIEIIKQIYGSKLEKMILFGSYIKYASRYPYSATTHPIRNCPINAKGDVPLPFTNVPSCPSNTLGNNKTHTVTKNKLFLHL